MANREEEKKARDEHVFEAARNGDLDLVMDLVKNGASMDMALMGATPDPKPDDGRGKLRAKVANWAVEQGATVLFGIGIEPSKWTTEGVKQPVFFSRLLNKKAGDVPRGTFKKQ
jgi:hypothetical protein